MMYLTTYFVCLLYIARDTAVVYSNSGKVVEGLQELHQVVAHYS